MAMLSSLRRPYAAPQHLMVPELEQLRSLTQKALLPLYAGDLRFELLCAIAQREDCARHSVLVRGVQMGRQLCQNTRVEASVSSADWASACITTCTFTADSPAAKSSMSTTITAPADTIRLCRRKPTRTTPPITFRARERAGSWGGASALREQQSPVEERPGQPQLFAKMAAMHTKTEYLVIAWRLGQGCQVNAGDGAETFSARGSQSLREGVYGFMSQEGQEKPEHKRSWLLCFPMSAPFQ